MSEKLVLEIAIRELVANALIHQDFTISGIAVMIEIYNNRLEISNPGEPLCLWRDSSTGIVRGMNAWRA